MVREAHQRKLTRTHIFVANSLDYLVAESIQRSGDRRGVCTKSRLALDAEGTPSAASAAEAVIGRDSANRLRLEGEDDESCGKLG